MGIELLIRITSLAQARLIYNGGIIDCRQLCDLFLQLATEEERAAYWNAPVYDRPGVAEGKTKAELDAEWNSFISNVPKD